MKKCEDLNVLSSDFIGYPSLKFVSSEEEVTDCPNNIDKEKEERKNYAEATREMCEDVRMKGQNKYKEIIKRNGKEMAAFLLQRCVK